MRIGIDLSPLSYGNRQRGIGVYAENLVRALARCDTNTAYTLFSLTGPEPYELPFPLPSNFSLVRLPSPPLGRARPLLSHQLFLPFVARARQLDALHLVAVPYNPSSPAVPYWHSVPLVVTLFDLTPLHLRSSILRPRYARFFRFQLRTCRRAARLITASNAIADELAALDLAPRARICVISLAAPAAAPAAPISPAMAELVAGAPYLLHVGGSEPQKNQDAVLRAFGLLCRDPAFHHRLILAGARHLDDAPALAQSPRAALRILRVTPTHRGDMDLLYARAGALLFPSSYEGFGLPVLEALQAGTPVVTSTNAALVELAGDAAIPVDPADTPAFARAVRRLLTDSAFRTNLQQRGVRRAAEFTWERTAARTREVYAQVAAFAAGT